LFTFFGFRYLEISATEDIEVFGLDAKVVGSDIEECGQVETSHRDVNKLISNVLWGQRSNFLSIPTDCPQRDERQGWTGDTQFFCNTAAYNANVLEFFRKWLTDARDSQHPNGCYHDVIPIVNGWGGGGSAWADAPLIVGQVMWRMYADREIIKENIEAFDRYMDWIATFGLRGPNPSYGDWLSYEPTPKEYISKAYYAWDAQIMQELHSAIGDADEAKKYSELYDEIKADFISNYIGDDGDLLEDYRTQTGYLLALHVGIYEGEESKVAADRLEKLIINNGYKLSTGFVGTAILCKTLAKFGKNNIAYSLLLQTEDPSWLYSVHQGATTIWERWNSYTLENGFGDVGMNSFNHYSFGAVMEWIYRFVVGIEFDVNAPGFKRVILQPKPDLRSTDEIPEGQERITWVKGRYNTKNGPIISEWSLVNGVFKYYAETPVSATLYLPIIPDKKSFVLNGKNIKLEDVRVDGDLVALSLESGKYTVEF
jgi:alpha-L-rhamnosidase